MSSTSVGKDKDKQVGQEYLDRFKEIKQVLPQWVWKMKYVAI